MPRATAAAYRDHTLFPYAELYPIWQRTEERLARDGNVLVYLDRITEPDGEEIVRYKAPSFFE